MSLAIAVAIGVAASLGCGDGTPDDPPMTPKESAEFRKGAYTPEQAKSRAERPR